LALCLGGCHQAAPAAESADDEAEPIAVVVEPVRRETIELTLSGVGLVMATPGGRTQVSNVIEGQVTEVLVAEGDSVEAGQPIARLDDRLAQIELADALAARDELSATLAALKAPPREPERMQAELDVERAKIATGIAEKALARLEPLRLRGEISEQQLFEARERVHDAQLAASAAAQRQRALLQGPTPEAIREAEAKVTRAETAIRSVRSRIELYTLKSSRAGVINRVSANPGQWLAIGTSVAEVIHADEVLVQVGVSPRDAARVALKQRATIIQRTAGGIKTSATSPHEDAQHEGGAQHAEASDSLVGEVSFIGREALAANGLAPVDIRVKNPNGALRLGTLVDVAIVIGALRDVLTVGESAIVPGEEGSQVIAVEDGKTKLVNVEVGPHDRGRVQVIAKALHEGDQIIARGAYNLPEDTPVAAEQADEGAAESATGAESEKAPR
jgi:RND family efflux transporter MFP subunit